MDKIYFDEAATTKVREEVYNEMMPYFTKMYGNASGIYAMARENRKQIDMAREKIANAINSKPKEIYFTSGGTESDNWAIKGVAEAYASKGKHIITTSIEHYAVLQTCKYLETKGYEVTYLNVLEDGLINLDDLKKAIRQDTILISIMFANNEIGTLQPVKEIGEIARNNNIIFHSDAVQALGSVKIDVEDMNIDLLSLSSHKIYGPKGVGALYIKNGVKVTPLIHGGMQERGKRGGTENVAGIIGFSKAVELAIEEMDEEKPRILKLRNKLIDSVISKIPNSRLNGHKENRLPGNANFSFDFIEGEGILLMLDSKNIVASSGSACTSGSLDPSHVLISIGLPYERAHGSLRISIGKYTTEEDVDYLLEVLPNIINKLRQMSPLYEEYIKNK